jgi:RsmE family RNA methyltransferase
LNLLLFEPDERGRPLAASDPRARHLREVLRCGVGDEFDAGLVGGPRGKGRIEASADAALSWTFTAQTAPPVADEIHLLVGLPRPQTARDILRDATTLGVAAIHFVATEKSEPSYAQSTLWHSGEWRRHVLAGAAQAFSTQVPHVTFAHALAEVLAALAPGGHRLALDNYEASRALRTCNPLDDKPVALALGPERGWGARDRELLRAAGFALVHLGERVLRLETAVVAALALAKSARGTL